MKKYPDLYGENDMRLTRQTRQNPQQSLNLPAMVDVVMLLLIFFMATSTFNPPEQHIETQLSSIAPGPNVEMEDFEPIEITVRKSQEDIVYYCDELAYSDRAQLKAQLHQRREIADMDIVIRAEDSIAFDRIIEVVDLCTALEFSSIGFGVEELP